MLLIIKYSDHNLNELCIATLYCNFLFGCQNKWTPLHVAVREDNALTVEKLINLGADIDALTYVSCLHM